MYRKNVPKIFIFGFVYNVIKSLVYRRCHQLVGRNQLSPQDCSVRVTSHEASVAIGPCYLSPWDTNLC